MLHTNIPIYNFYEEPLITIDYLKCVLCHPEYIYVDLRGKVWNSLVMKTMSVRDVCLWLKALTEFFAVLHTAWWGAEAQSENDELIV